MERGKNTMIKKIIVSLSLLLYQVNPFNYVNNNNVSIQIEKEYIETIYVDGNEYISNKLNKDQFDNNTKSEKLDRMKNRKRTIGLIKDDNYENNVSYIITPPIEYGNPPVISISGSEYARVVWYSDPDADIVSAKYQYKESGNTFSSWFSFSSGHFFGIPGYYFISVIDQEGNNATQSFVVNSLVPTLGYDNNIESINLPRLGSTETLTVRLNSTYEIAYSEHTFSVRIQMNSPFVYLHTKMVWVVPPTQRNIDIMLVGFESSKFELIPTTSSQVNTITRRINYTTYDVYPCQSMCDMGNYESAINQVYEPEFSEEITDGVYKGAESFSSNSNYLASFLTSRLYADLPSDETYFDPFLMVDSGVVNKRINRIEYNIYVGLVTNNRQNVSQCTSMYFFSSYKHAYVNYNINLDFSFSVNISSLNPPNFDIGLSITPNIDITTNYDNNRNLSIYLLNYDY